MSTTPKRYRKKPVVIEAMQWDGTAEGATPIINWILGNDGTARYHEPDWQIHAEPPMSHIAIDTIEGTMRATIGDYVIRGVQGEFYPCKPDIFEATYEPAD